MKLAALLEQATNTNPLTVAVAAADDQETIEAVYEAVERKLAHFLLFGDKEKINSRILQYQPSLLENHSIQIVDAKTVQEAATLAVKAVHNQEAQLLMKGHLSTSIILKAVLNKEYGLRTGSVLSHVAVFEVPSYDQFVFVTDAAMNIQPTLQEKAQILTNAVQVAQAVGIKTPKVAPIAAVEVVNENMQATVDAALLTQMNKRGQIQGCIVDGPLALDNAINIQAAHHKGITGEVAGQADILLVPTIEVGNVLYKSLVYFAKAKVGAVIAGAKAPIVLTSRADSSESKLYSLALAICVANRQSY
ncbi:phosphate butyryltransferase [Metabacillus iocasae]|uniref:Phosphate butyryltransferase n=1 Tax=Priestia iocasae TaxID=2291674 RepID=A0ABS2QQC1_9BACI|nr:phosphate butyryltransferase [Metabacillus iocasae]MBM7701600.1 phosphate butyryltransferase [Metabacillus iocasae]